MTPAGAPQSVLDRSGCSLGEASGEVARLLSHEVVGRIHRITKPIGPLTNVVGHAVGPHQIGGSTGYRTDRIDGELLKVAREVEGTVECGTSDVTNIAKTVSHEPRRSSGKSSDRMIHSLKNTVVVATNVGYSVRGSFEYRSGLFFQKVCQSRSGASYILDVTDKPVQSPVGVTITAGVFQEPAQARRQLVAQQTGQAFIQLFVGAGSQKCLKTLIVGNITKALNILKSITQGVVCRRTDSLVFLGQLKEGDPLPVRQFGQVGPGQIAGQAIRVLGPLLIGLRCFQPFLLSALGCSLGQSLDSVTKAVEDIPQEATPLVALLPIRGILSLIAHADPVSDLFHDSSDPIDYSAKKSTSRLVSLFRA
ncbi:hypothetical protein [Thalassobaculum salexigens]|uniref:hypothetical protein n=1 Tax=Thalassobaculum salexigens TaxID=455360 RepID=UPI00248F0357|nr:hypothetical protein [Thalassobaculum salexigens]